MTTVRYDSGCGLCRGFVEWASARDGRGRLRFVPLEEASDTVVAETGGGARLERSRAVLHVLAELGGAWGAVAVAGRLVPQPVADGVYRLVARNRCRIACGSQ